MSKASVRSEIDVPSKPRVQNRRRARSSATSRSNARGRPRDRPGAVMRRLDTPFACIGNLIYVAYATEVGISLCGRFRGTRTVGIYYLGGYMRIADKAVLVTGANRGIGKAL